LYLIISSILEERHLSAACRTAKFQHMPMMPPVVLSFSSTDLKELCLRHCATPIVL